MDAGRVGFLIKGDYDADFSYERLDVVYYNGSTWIARKSTIGNLPEKDSEYWQLALDAVATDNKFVGTKEEFNTALDEGLIKDGTLVYITDDANSSGGGGDDPTPPEPPKSYRIMTVKIDQNNSNPETCCTYHDDAEFMTPGSDEWDEFFGHYPVLLKDGVEVGKLNRNNFEQFEDGSPADIISGDAGDCMICFPKLGMKMSTDSNNVITLSMTDNPDAGDQGFEYNAHISSVDGVTIKDKFYVGAFRGSVLSNKLRSLKRNLLLGERIDTFRTYAQANGEGYNQSTYYRLLFRQCLCLLKYKNLNLQVALGSGYNGGFLSPGSTIVGGMDYVESSNNRIKCLGIEDFWGNSTEFIDGVCISNQYITVGTYNFGNTTDYLNIGYSNEYSFSYIDKVWGDTKKGFIIKGTSGSNTTYFCSQSSIGSSQMCIGCLGGYGTYNIFNLYLHRSINTIGGEETSRLEYI